MIFVHLFIIILILNIARLTFVVPDVPRTNATRLFEIRGEEIIHDGGFVFDGRQRRDDRSSGVVRGPRRRGRSVLYEQNRKQPEPDCGGPFFTHFRRDRLCCTIKKYNIYIVLNYSSDGCRVFCFRRKHTNATKRRLQKPRTPIYTPAIIPRYSSTVTRE